MDTQLQAGRNWAGDRLRVGAPNLPRQRRGRRTAPPPARSSDGFRADIQGLRAVAVLSVLGYHLWPSALPGGYTGVDVFFVISGFLITGHLLSVRPDTPRKICAFWVRRVRRLLPAALLVLTVTLVTARLLGPDSRWKHTAAESAMATLNVENWLLAYRSVDYLAAASPASPVQHYWSLSVEEQFYFFWPLLIASLAVVSARNRLTLPGLVLGVLIPLTAISFLYAIRLSASDPGPAFFVTPTRIWELSAGAVLAAVALTRGSAPRATASPRARSALSILGLSAIGAGLVCYDSATTWPGYATLLPVLGTAAVIGAHSPMSGISGRALGNRVVQRIGDASYSIYLWHWPILVLLPAATGRPLAIADKLVVVLLTLLFAWATKHLVEDRFRRVRPGTPLWRPLALAGAAMAAVVTMCGVVVLDAEREQRSASAAAESLLAAGDPCLGAGARAMPQLCGADHRDAFIPASIAAISDRPSGWSNGCLIGGDLSAFPACVRGPAQAPIKVALVGNSHGGQWQPALEAIVDRNGWQLTSYLATGCAPIAVEYMMGTQELRQNCLRWGQRVLDATTSGDFDLIVVSALTGSPLTSLTGGTSYPPETHSRWVSGYRDYLSVWADAGIPVLVIRDTPVPRETVASVPDCLAIHDNDVDSCSGPRERWVRPDPLAEAAVGMVNPRVQVVDLTELFCDSSQCFAVVGGVVVYFDGSHLTTTFARTMAPVLGPYLEAILQHRTGRADT